ncbi:MAG TPA: PepSY-associated TM helix domain-containing protein [Puia sp.]|nr:PepSY-associated TM helix domain-containing protein [Puia sp.]
MKLSPYTSRIIFGIHQWLGAVMGVCYLVIGLSGSLLLFRDEFDNYFNRDLHDIKAGTHPAPLDSMFHKIAAHYKDTREIDLIRFPGHAGDCYEFLLFREVPNHFSSYLYAVFINPYNNEIIREGDYGTLSASFFRWLYQFHYCFQLGTVGMLTTGIVALLMLGSLLTGFIVYRKHITDIFHRKSYTRIRYRRSAASALHRIIGVWGLLFNSIIFFTGFWLNLPAFERGSWTKVERVRPVLPAASMEPMLGYARSLGNFSPVSVYVPLDSGSDVKIVGRFTHTLFLVNDYASYVSFSKQSGKLTAFYDIRKQSWWDKLDAMVYQVHTGKMGAVGIKFIYLLIGLTPGILFITGAILWWRRLARAKRYGR